MTVFYGLKKFITIEKKVALMRCVGTGGLSFPELLAALRARLG